MERSYRNGEDWPRDAPAARLPKLITRVLLTGQGRRPGILCRSDRHFSFDTTGLKHKIPRYPEGLLIACQEASFTTSRQKHKCTGGRGRANCVYTDELNHCTRAVGRACYNILNNVCIAFPLERIDAVRA